MITTEYLEAMLQDVAKLHHEFEQKMGIPDDQWPRWYAARMLGQMRNDFGRSPSNPLEYPRHA